MLSDQAKKLLCRAVDDDLNDRQRLAVQQLLRESDEARALYQSLRDDALRLRQLPRTELTPDVAARLQQAVGCGPIIVQVPVRRPSRGYLPVWTNVAVALGVLIAVAAGTYSVVTLKERENTNREIAETKRLPDDLPRGLPNAREIDDGKVVAKASVVDKLKVMPRLEDLDSAPLPELPDMIPPGPEEKPRLFMPFNPRLEPFKVSMPKLPPILRVRELDQATQRSQFLESIAAAEAVHLDLFCQDANKALERILTTLKAQNKSVLVEALARLRLENKLKTNYVLYTAAFSAQDVVDLFAALSADEQRSAVQMEEIVPLPMLPVDYRTLAALLGVEPRQLLQREKPPVVDPQKPLIDSTAEHLAKALAEKNRAPAGEVLALSYNPVRPNPSLSKEVREFLASHKERKSGHLALMLVVRNKE